MAPAVFVNYRGEDSQMWGTLIYLALSRHFGESRVFLDCSSLQPGDDFERVLLDRVRESTLLLAVIGPRWLTATSESGERLIDSSEDWVHRELAEAFAVGVRVIPVLTDGADMPTAEMLPLDIAALGRRQFVRVRRRQATDDLAGLVGKVAELEPALSPVPAGESVGTAPARAAGTRRGRPRVRLPAQLTDLLGRAGEIGQVGEALSVGRLVTLVGPGGVGKTRLALAAAAAVADRFVDGVVFVPLAEVKRADLVVAAVARMLDVREVPGLPLLDCVVDHLAGVRLLLLLDNFEQVLDAGTAVSAILAAVPGAAVLVTSREPLNLYGERVHRVSPLHVAQRGELPPGAAGVVQALTGSAAVALFDQRARAVNADFELTPANLAAVLTICRRLDGLPLAIELAAAHAGRFSPAALLTGLTGHLEAPGSGPRDRPERQRTLRGAIGWSYDLLDSAQQRLFRRFAVFAGGATLEAAAAVVDADRPVEPGQAFTGHAGPGAVGSGPDLTGRLAVLAAKNLLVVEASGGVRYRMLETIRAYATALLAEDPAQDLAHARHATYYVDLAEQVGSAMAGRGQAGAAERLEQDYQNLRAAMAWMLVTGQLAEATRACLGLWRHWRTGRHLTEGRSWLREVLAAPAGLPDDMRGRVLNAAAVLAAAQDDHEVAARLAAECLTLADSAGDRPAAAQAHNASGIAAIGAGDYPTAAAHFRCSLATCRQLTDQHGTAIALGNLARLSLRLDEIPTAARYIDECLRIERATGNTYGIILGLEILGRICLVRRDLPAAGTALRESLALSREIGDIYGQTAALHLLGLVAHDAGDRDTAFNLLTEALDRHYELDCPEDLAISLDCLANATADRHPTSAARLLGTADQLRRRHRLPIPSENETRRDATLTILRTRLDQTAFTAAWNTGHTTGPDETIHEATDLRGHGKAAGLPSPQSRK